MFYRLYSISTEKIPPMSDVTAHVDRLQALLGSVAPQIAAETQFIQRTRKITPLSWLLATVFGWMHNKEGTLNTIVENFEQQGIDITEQGVSKRLPRTPSSFSSK